MRTRQSFTLSGRSEQQLPKTGNPHHPRVLRITAADKVTNIQTENHQKIYMGVGMLDHAADDKVSSAVYMKTRLDDKTCWTHSTMHGRVISLTASKQW